MGMAYQHHTNTTKGNKMTTATATKNQNWTDLGAIPLYETATSKGRLVLSRNEDDGGIQLRVFTETSTYDGPTKKGFTVTNDKMDDLKDLVGLLS